MARYTGCFGRIGKSARGRRQPPNKRLQLTPNSSFESVRGTVLAVGAAPQRWRSALLGAAEPQVR
jgi:hypothetical protein